METSIEQPAAGCDGAGRSHPALSFLVVGQHLRVACADAALREVLAANYGAMAFTPAVAPPDLDYSITAGATASSFFLLRRGQPPLAAADTCELLYLLERDVTLELQRRRPELLFLHAATLEWRGGACVLAAEAGSGKSTTAWALSHHAFGYLSDELAPVDLDCLRVLPYPHALCLKDIPPAYPLPPEAIDLGRTIHVPVRCLPGAAITEPRPLEAVFLLLKDRARGAPELRVLSASEAGARLYVIALNTLAHPRRGLDAVLRIAESVPCYALASAELAATCALIRATLGRRARVGQEAVAAPDR